MDLEDHFFRIFFSFHLLSSYPNLFSTSRNFFSHGSSPPASHSSQFFSPSSKFHNKFCIKGLPKAGSQDSLPYSCCAPVLNLIWGFFQALPDNSGLIPRAHSSRILCFYFLSIFLLSNHNWISPLCTFIKRLGSYGWQKWSLVFQVWFDLKARSFFRFLLWWCIPFSPHSQLSNS